MIALLRIIADGFESGAFYFRFAFSRQSLLTSSSRTTRPAGILTEDGNVFLELVVEENVFLVLGTRARHEVVDVFDFLRV